MKILVTGGAGYIGSHTVSLLLSNGHSVVIVDNLSTGMKAACPSQASLHVADICDRPALEAIVAAEKPEAILHFAGKISVPESVKNPLDYYETNTYGTLNVLRAAEKVGVKFVIFSSTAAVYGDVRTDLVTENMPVKPINPYGHSKAFAEQIIRSYADATDTKYGILRYFNVAGAAADGKNGQRGMDVGQLIHVAAEAAIGIREELQIFGEDYTTPDGTCIRDFIHVEDLAGAHLSTLDYMVTNRSSAIFNVGYGQGASVKAVVSTMMKVSGRQFIVKVAGRRAGDPEKVVADSTRIRQLTDWRPRYAALDTICRSSLEWLKKRTSSNA